MIFIFLSRDKVIYECFEALSVLIELRSSARHNLFAFINIILKITKACIDFTNVFLEVAFQLHVIVVQLLAGNFLNIIFGFFDAAFYLIFVHECFLIII